MKRYIIEDALKKTLQKLRKKDRKLFDVLAKKMQEIVAQDDLAHYKNLRKPLNEWKRIHIESHFVLLFHHDRNEDAVIFHALDHHDNIYKK